MFVQQSQGSFSVAALCRVMQVSMSGYYAWRKRPPSRHRQQSAHLTEQIQQVHQHSDPTYGSPRIYHELKAQGLACSENRIVRLMHQHGISAQPVKRFVVTTQANPTLPVAENVLARQFEVQTPNACWTADITYVWTGEG